MLASPFRVRLWALWNLWFLSVSSLMIDVIVRSVAFTHALGMLGLAIGTYTGLVASYRLSKLNWPSVFGLTKAVL
jgi:hypothetical protein